MRSNSLWHFFCVHTKLTYMPESFINSWMLTYLCCTLWEHYHVNKPYRSVIWQTRTVSIITHQWYSHLCSFQHRCVHVHRHTRSLTVHPQHIHTIQHSSPVLASLYLMILTLHAQQRGTPFCTESLRGYNKRQKRRLCCALSFFPWQKKKKKEREGWKEKKIRPAAIKQLHFRVCWSWRSVFVGGQWRKRRQAPVLQPDNKDSPPS